MYCPSPIHRGKKELSLQFRTSSVAIEEHNWIKLLYIHFWIEDEPLLSKALNGAEDPFKRVDFLINYVLHNPELGRAKYGVNYEICFFTVAASSEKGVRIPKEKLCLGDYVQCPRCSEEGKLALIQRGTSKYLAVTHGKFYHLLKVVESSKEPKERCPKCGQLGKKIIDKRGYVYFWHFKEGVRVKHYVGKLSW